MNRIDEIKARLSAVGNTLPWKTSENYSTDYYYQGWAVQTQHNMDIARCIEEKEEVDFLSNAPADIEFLLYEITRIKYLSDKMEEQLVKVHLHYAEKEEQRETDNA